VKKLFIIFALVIVLYSCNDPIFYAISMETPKLKSLIDGSPTNFVAMGTKMYAASGRNIWEYENGSWTRYGQGIWIVQLAATASSLYALCEDGSIKSFDSSMTPQSPPSISGAKKIFTANNVLIICVGIIDSDKNISYAIYSGSNPTSLVLENISLLNGAAFDGTNYYLCTNSGIYTTTTLTGTATPIGDSAKDFVGIIGINNPTVFAITRDGVLYKIETSGITEVASFGSRYATGALAIWTDGTDKLLLAGRQDKPNSTTSGYTYGYLEIVLDGSGDVTGSFKEPGIGDPTTVSNNERYKSSLGTKPVNHIFQALDGFLFASTQKDGVWSYRVREDGSKNLVPQWNAEAKQFN